MGSLSVKDALQVNYDEYYGSAHMERWRRVGAADKADNICRLCQKYPHSVILDVGCGDGAVMERLNELDFGDQYYGIEISSSALDVLGRKKIDRLVETMRFDGYQIPYDDKKFDLAILSHVVEHVEYPRKLLYEVGRVARFVYVEVPLEHTLRLGKNYIPDPVGHINFYTDKTIRRLLQTCDFEVMEQLLVDDSRDVVEMTHGRVKGRVRYMLRRASFHSFPSLAKYVFVYNSAVLCKSPNSQGK